MGKKGIKNKITRMIKRLAVLCNEKEVVPIPTPMDSGSLLVGKVALITGGSSGIGKAIAKSFVRNGCDVVIAGTNEDKLKQSVCEIGEEHTKYLVINVLQVSEIPEKVEAAAQLFGTDRLDILVNSAGVVAKAGFADMTEQEYDMIMDVNAKGTFFMCQAVSKFMIKHAIKGHILNLSSSSALRPAWTPYHMSKWAVRGLTIGLADALLSHGIVVNAIAPGPVATPMMGKGEGDSIYHETSPAGRYAMPSEIAELATFMVSDMGNMIVGDTFYITGGSGVTTLHN